ncbi:MAG: hypothetical protein HC869_25445 [Rhodospirillales bacterium]|nr:hypothetical protein [Rhodospirillales bacterium]
MRDAVLSDAGTVPTVIAPTVSNVPMEAAPPIALAAAPTSSAAPKASLAALAQTVDQAETPLAFDLRAQLVARVDGKAAGMIDFRQTTIGLSVRLGSIVNMLSDRYDADDVARIANSAASKVYVSLAELQAQGIPISYDPIYDEFNIGQAGTRPKVRAVSLRW